MLRRTRVSSASLAVLLVAGAVLFAPVSSPASPIGKLLHLHPRVGPARDSRVTLQVYNKGDLFQDLMVDGQIYTVLSHNRLAIKAVPGTAVYAASTGLGHRKGDLLFTVTPEMKDAIITLQMGG